MKNIGLIFLFVFSIGACSAQETEKKGGNIDVAEAVELLKDKEVKVLDVRTPKEIAGGAIESAKFLNYRDKDFKEQLAELPKEETYLVYCHGGGRSGKTMSVMKNLGFTSVYNLKGGITAWNKAGNKISK